YISVRFGSESYTALIGEESKGGIRITEKRRVEVNNENLSENGFDREALKRLFSETYVQEYTVVMPPQEVITGIVEFPLTDRKKIESALKFELENETMESPENLLYDYRVINNQDNKTQVIYYAAKKDSIRTVLSEMQILGVDPAYLVSQQNLCSGLYKSVFEKKAPKGVKLFLDISDGMLTLSFVDSEGISFGRVMGIKDIRQESQIIRNFIAATIQYFRIRARREVNEAYIISDDDSAGVIYELLSQDIGLSPVSRLSFRDAESADIESDYVMLFAALNGRVELTRKQIINFRKDEFIYKGEYDFLKKQIVKYGVAALIVILLALSLTVYKFRMLSKYDEQLNNSLAEVTKQILGKPYDNFTTALAVIKSKTEPKNLSIPTNSAFDYFMFFSDSFPQDVDVNIRVLEIGDKKIRMEGETDSFESVDRVVNSLKKNTCFKDITKGKVKKSPDGKKIDFDLSITPSC
ncbi:MAG: hypothetical protein N3B13_10315, partial [Deltaproteobacteria bacterium]|nr:hypothetical protein [Deltaproteobacteria bacterium]